MEYKSPLGLNFNLKKSQKLAEEAQARLETPNKNQEEIYISLHSESQPRRDSSWTAGQNWKRYPRNTGTSGFNNSPRNNWASPSQRHENSTPITLYYHPAMVKNPWNELERKT